MKLFGNSKGKHSVSDEVRRPAPVSPAAPAPKPEIAPPPVVRGQPKIAVAEIRSEAASETAPARPRRNGFRIGLLIYIAVFFALTFAGLYWLWNRMDVFEKSRPQNAIDAWMEAADGSYFRALLTDGGIDADYIATMDLEDASYYKLLGHYTDDAPTWFSVTLREGAPLAFDSHEWEVGGVELLRHVTCVYAPFDAEIILGDAPLGTEHLIRADAAELPRGVFDGGAADYPTLAKYAIDKTFGPESLLVTDASGAELPLAASTADSYYYYPLTHAYVISAPSSYTVTVNGVALTAENAEITRAPIPELEGIDSYVAALPETVTYTIDGLVAQPEVAAETRDGMALVPAAAEGNAYTFVLENDEALEEDQYDRILEVFDAHVAYNTNRNGNTTTNYNRFRGCLVPGSDAANRAYRALETVIWAAGRSAALSSAEIGEVLRYADDCFTARVDFTLVTDEEENSNSYLYVFVRYGGEWRVARFL